MSKSQLTPSRALFVQAIAGQGFAAPHNNQPANFLVVITDAVTGEAITNLVQKEFQIIDHFLIPGATCGFSNHISLFQNIGTGAYQIQVTLGGCNWVRGDYLAQIIVSSHGRNGQATATLSVR